MTKEARVKVNHTDPVLSFDGVQLQEPTEVDGKVVLHPVTYRSLVMAALNGTVEREQMSAEDKMRCYHLALKFWDDDVIELSVSDAEFIKQRGLLVLQALPAGRLADWIEAGA